MSPFLLRPPGKDLLSEVAFLARELKTPVINETFAALGDQARTEGWSHEEYLAAVLGRQVASRTRMRIVGRLRAGQAVESGHRGYLTRHG